MKRRSGPRPVAIEPLETRALLSAVKIMPLGDSITESFPGHASYRFFLYNQLVQAGYDVDFVGGQTGVNGGTPLYTNFDQNHEGHSGWRADEIAANIITWATANKPDIVLLHIGTNDVTQGQTNASTITDIGNIIDNLRTVVPNVKILLAKIIPSTGYTTQESQLNTSIGTLATQKNTANSPVIVVDQYTGFSTSTDLFDGLHPNDSGERKISNKWLSALTPILPAPTPQPVTYLSDLTWTSMSNGWGSIEKDRSNGETGATDGHTLALNASGYLKGLGAHAASDVTYNISGGGYTSFQSDIGVDEEVGNGGSVVFQVYVNGTLQYTSPKLTGSSATVPVNIALSNATTLRLVITDSGDGNAYDHADWANARLVKGTPPSAPTLLGLSIVNNQVQLNWTDNASNETGFRVERKTGSSGTYAQIADIAVANTQTYTDTTAQAGVTYYYRVYAYGTGGASGYSNEPNITLPPPPAPTDPTTLVATPVSYQQVNLTWVDTSGNETGFRVERKTGSGGTYAQIADLAANTQSYSDTTVAANTTYYYRVYAYNLGGNSGYTNEYLATTAAAPQFVYFSDQPFTVDANGWGTAEKDRSNGEQGSADGHTITLNGVTYTKGVGIHATSQLTLNLNKQYGQFLSDIGVDDEVGNNGSVVFQVWLDNVKVYDSGTMTGSSATKSININTQNASQLRLIVTDSGNGADYDHADWANARLVPGAPTPPPAAPTNLTATLNGGKVDLAWQDSTGDQTGFRIERKLGVNGTYATVQTVSGTTFNWSDASVLASNSTYYYRVFATNIGGDSAQASNEAFITTPAAPAQTFLSDLAWTSMTNGWGSAEKDKSNGEQGTGDGHTISLHGVTYAKGLGVHAASTIVYNLGGSYSTFISDVGIDDETNGGGSVNFQVYLDNVLVYDSGKMFAS
ncbi:MAG TPA: NPCBM/NEW2 domain-containing protein, partial [Tepidisphaeraceae bacterium]|nr:NPCBM/NEW2 domain-containing protein [Tepidisphaeraceae bacterium]